LKLETLEALGIRYQRLVNYRDQSLGKKIFGVRDLGLGKRSKPFDSLCHGPCMTSADDEVPVDGGLYDLNGCWCVTNFPDHEDFSASSECSNQGFFVSTLAA
jgi:hypothetical protein